MEDGRSPSPSRLSTRQLAEQAAAPADIRVHYWLQPLVDRADADRRGAEDRLFVGAAAELNRADGLWKSAVEGNGQDSGYAAAIRRASQVAAAYQTRDRAWAELPYLAQWTLTRQQAAESDEGDLRSAIEGVGQLASRLDEQLAARQWSPESAALAAKFDGALQALDKRFQAECAELKTAGEDKHTLRRIAAVLAVPLLSGAERNGLRDKGLSIARKIAPAGTQYEVAVAEKVASEAGDVAKRLDRLRHWEIHPAAMILQSGQTADVPPLSAASAGGPPADQARTRDRDELAQELLLKRLAQQGADVRRALGDLPDAVQHHLQETAKRLEQKTADAPDVVRAGDSRADRLTRAAALFLDARLRNKMAIEPADQLRRLDLRYLLLWHGSRTLDDFWGPAAEGQSPYFAVVAREYGQSADKLRKGVPHWTSVVERFAEAARKGITPLVEPKNVFVDENDPAVRHAFSVTVPENTPKGTAAVYLQDPAGLMPLWSEKRDVLRRLGLALAEPGTLSTPPYWIPNDARLKKADRLQAVALYRGQVRSDDFYVPPATGLDIVYTRPDYPKPTIVVRGELRQTSAVMFIFDCSGSMGAHMLVEGKETTRFNVARDTLKAILRRMAASESPFDVGLMVYGHRVGWNPENTSELVVHDPRFPHAFRFIPRPPQMAQIKPSNDLELFLSPGPFGQNEFDELSRKLDGLDSMGETPLYLSIIEAIRHLRKEGAAGQRRIVAITDGVNNQTGGGPDVRYREDVEQELKKPGNERIHLDVVGFNIEKQEAGLSVEETARRLNDLRELARSTGGAFHDTSDPTTLLRALQRSLSLSQYVVETLPGGRRITPEPLELNTPCVIERPPPQARTTRCGSSTPITRPRPGSAWKGARPWNCSLPRGATRASTGWSIIAMRKTCATPATRFRRPGTRRSVRSTWRPTCRSGGQRRPDSSSRSKMPTPSNSVPGPRRRGSRFVPWLPPGKPHRRWRMPSTT